VQPILHLNGYNIADPRWIPEDELVSLMSGSGYLPYLVVGSDPASTREPA